MSNYQRLISYIYTYESGLKGKNVGFAKLETRNSQCRLTVNVKKVVPVGSPLGVRWGAENRNAVFQKRDGRIPRAFKRGSGRGKRQAPAGVFWPFHS